jgi:hypothetical protein
VYDERFHWKLWKLPLFLAITIGNHRGLSHHQAVAEAKKAIDDTESDPAAAGGVVPDVAVRKPNRSI